VQDAYVPSGAPALNSIYYLSGTMLFPEGDADAMVFSSQFDLIIAPAGSPDKAMPMPPATVWILGKVKTVINKDWFLDVSTYDRIVSLFLIFLNELDSDSTPLPDSVDENFPSRGYSS
jgi:hypothetical protein